jgi:hypothetical protein
MRREDLEPPGAISRDLELKTDAPKRTACSTSLNRPRFIAGAARMPSFRQCTRRRTADAKTAPKKYGDKLALTDADRGNNIAQMDAARRLKCKRSVKSASR